MGGSFFKTSIVLRMIFKKRKPPFAFYVFGKLIFQHLFSIASPIVFNIFPQNLLFGNFPNRYGEAKKSQSPIVPYFYSQKIRSCGPTRIIPRESAMAGGQKLLASQITGDL